MGGLKTGKDRGKGATSGKKIQKPGKKERKKGGGKSNSSILAGMPI